MRAELLAVLRALLAGVWQRCIAGAALALGATAALAAAQAGSAASAPSSLPQLRVVQAMHTAPIDQIRADAGFQRLVTSSSDKTLRIWRLADLQPLRSVALPSEPGREGTPYTVAISADGQRIYAAGYTGWQWFGGAQVYVIDANLGRIVGTLGRFDGEVVTALDLSPDGRRLAVGLGRGGLVVLDVASGRRLRSDALYAGAVMFAHHAADGRLATSAADGCLRVYAAQGALLHRQQFPPRPSDQAQCTGGRLGGVRFSPDGRWLALGDRDHPALGLFDGRSLQLQRQLRAAQGDQASLCCVAWSTDSRSLYANGSVAGDAPTPLYRVSDLASGQLQRWQAARQDFSNMLPLPGGALLYATTAPALARVGADGQVLSVAPDNIDFHRTRRTPAAFVLAADASAIAFEAMPGRWWQVQPLRPDADQVLRALPGPAAGMAAARRSGVQVQLSDAPGGGSRVNGHPLALALDEQVRSWAGHASLPLVALGTQWRLHVVDAQGRPLPGWLTPPFLPAPALHTLISGDGRWVVVAVGDGTVRWFDLASGQERLGLFVHANGVDWVAWRPDGHYASSPHGDRHVGWLVNRGSARSPDFFRALQFERVLYRPDLVQQALQPQPPSALAGAAAQLAATLQRLAAPRVAIEAIVPAADGRSLSIQLSAQATGAPITALGVFVDGLPVLAAAARQVAVDEAQLLRRTLWVPVVGRAGSVRVEAESAQALGLDESMAPAPLPAPAVQPPGRLWLLAIGVGGFDKLPPTVLRPLPLATLDAQALVRTLTQQRAAVFSDLHSQVLSDNSPQPPRKSAILAGLRTLEAMQPQDTALVFVAAHGFSVAGEYFLLPRDADPADLRRLQAARAAGQRPAEDALPSLLSGTMLMAALRRLPGRRVLVLDTCHAGALGSSDPYALIKRSASAQLALVSAARGDEASFDAPDRSGGVFTQALVRALAGQGQLDRAKGGAISLRQAFDAAQPQVQLMLQTLQARMATPQQRAAIRQTPVLSALPVLQASVLAQPAD